VIPAGLIEDLELERFAVAELEQRAAALWRAGSLVARAAAVAERRLAADARARVAELELRLAAATK